MLERTVASVVPENSECRLLKKISEARRDDKMEKTITPPIRQSMSAIERNEA